MGWVFNSITREWNEPNESSIGDDLPDDTWVFGEASAVRNPPRPAFFVYLHLGARAWAGERQERRAQAAGPAVVRGAAHPDLWAHAAHVQPFQPNEAVDGSQGAAACDEEIHHNGPFKEGQHRVDVLAVGRRRSMAQQLQRGPNGRVLRGDDGINALQGVAANGDAREEFGGGYEYVSSPRTPPPRPRVIALSACACVRRSEPGMAR